MRKGHSLVEEGRAAGFPGAEAPDEIHPDPRLPGRGRRRVREDLLLDDGLLPPIRMRPLKDPSG
ncbi:MAG: hypothetical protein MZU79_02530 [Anaerotruncus sp.]|nr:hypothetical protein [Anaerotruncus sp.]